MLDDLELKLERRVRIVRSARIESAKRYKKDNEFYRWITIVYSILITCLSIWFVVPNEMIDNARLAAITPHFSYFCDVIYNVHINKKSWRKGREVPVQLYGTYAITC